MKIKRVCNGELMKKGDYQIWRRNEEFELVVHLPYGKCIIFPQYSFGRNMWISSDINGNRSFDVKERKYYKWEKK